MVKINPSLMFAGACGDAFRRYASLFGGEIVYMLTYAESPLAREVPLEWRDKVWFARLRAGGLDVTGGDMLPHLDYETPRGFSMVVGVANAEGHVRVPVAQRFLLASGDQQAKVFVPGNAEAGPVESAAATVGPGLRRVDRRIRARLGHRLLGGRGECGDEDSA